MPYLIVFYLKSADAGKGFLNVEFLAQTECQASQLLSMLCVNVKAYKIGSTKEKKKNIEEPCGFLVCAFKTQKLGPSHDFGVQPHACESATI